MSDFLVPFGFPFDNDILLHSTKIVKHFFIIFKYFMKIFHKIFQYLIFFVII